MRNRQARPLFALVLSIAAIGMLPLGGMLACSTDATGTEACRAIESERCKIAPVCAGVKGSPNIKTADEIANCTSYYHDHCLVGLENTKNTNPPSSVFTPCVDTLAEVATCQKPAGGVAPYSTILDCNVAREAAGQPDIVMENIEDVTKAPCDVLAAPELLHLCFFIESQTTAATTATTTTTTATTGSGGTGGTGGGTL